MIEMELRFEHGGKTVQTKAILDLPADAPLEELERECGLWAAHFARCIAWFVMTGGPEKRT